MNKKEVKKKAIKVSGIFVNVLIIMCCIKLFIPTSSITWNMIIIPMIVFFGVIIVYFASLSLYMIEINYHNTNDINKYNKWGLVDKLAILFVVVRVLELLNLLNPPKYFSNILFLMFSICLMASITAKIGYYIYTEKLNEYSKKQLNIVVDILNKFKDNGFKYIIKTNEKFIMRKHKPYKENGIWTCDNKDKERNIIEKENTEKYFIKVDDETINALETFSKVISEQEDEVRIIDEVLEDLHKEKYKLEKEKNNEKKA